ncbi:pilus assembly protein N-terminal domain-containing protein [Pyxidicoccus xibeiensis]|uniref:pilus assembly protein N-terminal domain-containing protein n=1 Tax=Pyxidicoccus xibeiensis TaxID=2906759 RepID=UPI0020A71823|nr:pilus assembly protein N-terminal domain-containing protein [Pyxidicoccus xibeiensis]MCP3138952.1 pilus assembly protein N-terminal domain-containing protein [Pyxidicoccus xibeiensis]
MPSLANPSPRPLPPRRPSASGPRRWLWAPLLLTLAAPAVLAEPSSAAPTSKPAEADFAAEVARAESSSEVVRVAVDHQANLYVPGAEHVRVDAPEVLDAGVGEPNLISLAGLRAGRAELLVLRTGRRPLHVRVEVAR